ncbi:MAG: L-threonylcarbamoyladenylate synthase [Acidimicrobiia bacterium]
MTDPHAEIGHAVSVLRAGGLVAFPTETVYGLGADAANPEAVARLYAVKGRPTWHPVIVHLADREAVNHVARALPDWGNALADAFWPGPMTLVVPRATSSVCDAVTGGMATVGIRIPNQPLALELLHAFGGGVAAPSANRFGRVSPTSADDVRNDLGNDVDVVLDGGSCAVGVESTIVDCTGEHARVLRQGGITVADLAAVLGYKPEVVTHDTSAEDDNAGVRAPGTLASHYAPLARVELVAPDEVVPRAHALLAERAAVGVLGLQAMVPTPLPAGAVLLGAPETDEVYARTLYRCLREADRREVGVILAILPEDAGVGAAVCDRLRRAGAPA